MKSKIHPAVAAAALPALVGLALTVHIVFLSEQKRTEDLMQAYTESIARGVSAFFADAATIAAVAATLNTVQELDWERASMDFMALISAAQYVNRISLVNSEGHVYDVYATGPAGNRWQGGRRTVDNMDRNAEPVNLSGLPHFRELVAENRRGEFYTITNQVYVPHGMHAKAFVTTAPIIKEGRAIGAVNVAQTSMELSRLYEDLATDFLDKFGRTARLFLASRNGNLVSSLEYNRTYGAYMDELFGTAEIVSVFELGDDAAAAILEAAENEKSIVETAIHGRRHLIAGVEIDNTPFAVCLAVLKSQMHYVSRYIVVIGGISLAGTAICAGIAFFAVSRKMKGRPENKEKPPRPRRKRRLGNARHSSGGLEDFAPPELPPEN